MAVNTEEPQMKAKCRSLDPSTACRVLATLLTLALGGPLMAMESPVKVTNLAELRQARKIAAHRKRRIIFNNDGDETVYQLKEATEKAFLAARTAPLLGSQVDSIFYCTWSSGFSFFTHNTKVGQVFDTTANPKHPHNKMGGFSRNKTADFIKQGTDPLKMMVKFCKQNDIEVLWSFRMNDTHDAWGSWYGEHLVPQVKKDHPEWLVSPLKKGAKPGSTSVEDYERSKHGGWSAMDFNHKGVRDLAVKLIEEVCENYDVDGIEMDFFRHLIYLKNPAWGKDATQAELDKMTSMVRRVRKVTERVGLKRGRPILVGVRVPDSVDYCKAMGIDIVRWLAEDLVDILAVTGYFRLNPWEVSVKLGHKYGVPVYPCLSETLLRDREASRARASLAAYRARAANVWHAGADGVYTFNAFDPRSPLWRQLGDPRTLETLDKVYTPGARGVHVINTWMRNGEKRFLNRRVLSPERPMTLEPGKAASVELRVGERIRERPAEGLAPDVQLRVRVQKLPDAADLSVGLNGHLLSGAAKTGVWLDYSVAPSLVKKGVNRFEITLAPGSAAKPILQDLALSVTYRKGR